MTSFNLNFDTTQIVKNDWWQWNNFVPILYHDLWLKYINTQHEYLISVLNFSNTTEHRDLNESQLYDFDCKLF